MVIRLAFLFSNGDEKERPAVVIIATISSPPNTLARVGVMPITHTPPLDQEIALELPTRLKNHLQLDDARSWVITNEINEFEWPGFDLRPIPGKSGKWEYGQMPPGFIAQIIERVKHLEHP